MSFWEHLFDSNWRQRHDINYTRDVVADTTEDVASLQYEVRTLTRRLNRVELVAEALFVHLEEQGQLDKKRLREIMAEIDRADGNATVRPARSAPELRAPRRGTT